MTTLAHNTRAGGRAIGLGPWLMLAVTLIVLTSGGVNTARLIGSAGVGLALTVLPERAGQAKACEPEVGVAQGVKRRVEVRGWFVTASRADDELSSPLMARLGLIDLPPPSLS